MTDPLLEAARAERDRRAETFPERIREGADPEALSIEYQCWVAIAEWLDTDRFFSFAGGANPGGPDAPLIRWPELEAAAESALTARSAKIAALEGQPNVRPETLGELRRRRSCLFAIHRKVQAMRESVDIINAEFRSTQGRELAA